MHNVMEHIDYKSFIASNINRLKLTAVEYLVIVGIIEIKKYNKNPFPEDVAKYFDYDLAVITKAFNDLMKVGHIKYTANELSFIPLIDKCMKVEAQDYSLFNEVEDFLGVRLDEIEKSIISELNDTLGAYKIISSLRDSDCPKKFTELIPFIKANNTSKFNEIENTIKWINN